MILDVFQGFTKFALYIWFNRLLERTTEQILYHNKSYI